MLDCRSRPTIVIKYSEQRKAYKRVDIDIENIVISSEETFDKTHELSKPFDI